MRGISVLPRTIVVAYDFSEGGRRALAWARTLHARLHASVVVLHADADLWSESVLGEDARRYEGPDAHARRMRWLESELRREVDEHFGPDSESVLTHVLAGRPSEVLCEKALELGADLVVVGASGKSAVERILLGSTAHALLRDCPVAVMTVP